MQHARQGCSTQHATRHQRRRGRDRPGPTYRCLQSRSRPARTAAGSAQTAPCPPPRIGSADRSTDAVTTRVARRRPPGAMPRRLSAAWWPAVCCSPRVALCAGYHVACRAACHGSAATTTRQCRYNHKAVPLQPQGSAATATRQCRYNHKAAAGRAVDEQARQHATVPSPLISHRCSGPVPHTGAERTSRCDGTGSVQRMMQRADMYNWRCNVQRAKSNVRCNVRRTTCELLRTTNSVKGASRDWTR